MARAMNADMGGTETAQALGKKVFEHIKRMPPTPADKPAFGFAGAKPQAVAPKNLPPVFDGDMILTCARFDTAPRKAPFREGR